MEFTGGCFCGEVRYRVSGEVVIRAMCLCRECQLIAGGGPNFAMTVAEKDFAYTKGAPKTFARPDCDEPARRKFCGTCGTHLVSRSSRVSGQAVIKAGSLDDPAVYGMPTLAAFTAEGEPYDCIPEGVALFETIPQRA